MGSMSQVKIDESEWYPVYSVASEANYPAGPYIEVPDDKLKRWAEAFAAFDAVQGEMKPYHQAAESLDHQAEQLFYGDFPDAEWWGLPLQKKRIYWDRAREKAPPKGS